MKYIIFFVLLYNFSIVSLASDIESLIEIQLISNASTKTYYAVFSDSTKNFIFYDRLY